MKKIVTIIIVLLLFLVQNYPVKAGSQEFVIEEEDLINVFTRAQGTTFLVDSNYKWAIKYPGNVNMVHKSESGTITRFEEVNGEFTLQITVEEYKHPSISNTELVKKLRNSIHSGQEILTETYTNNEISKFALITAEDGGEDVYFEYRAYFDNQKIYYVSLWTENEYDENLSENGKYQDLLNSFTTIIDQNVQNIIDVASEDGYVTYKNNFSGLSMKIPSNWIAEYWFNGLTFSNEDNTQNLWFNVSSIGNIDSLIKQGEKHYKETYVNYSMEALKKVKISGETAFERKVNNKFGDTWWVDHHIYLNKGPYTYLIVISYEKINKDNFQSIVDTMLESISIDTKKINPDLGFVLDNPYKDKTKTYKVVSERDNYSVEIPVYWEPIISDNYIESFMFEFGGFAVTAYDSGIDSERDIFEKGLEEQSVRYEKQETEIDGEKAYKYTYSAEQDGFKNKRTTYLVEYKGLTYWIELFLFDSTNTKENRDALQKTLESFKFLKLAIF